MKLSKFHGLIIFFALFSGHRSAYADLCESWFRRSIEIHASSDLREFPQGTLGAIAWEGKVNPNSRDQHSLFANHLSEVQAPNGYSILRVGADDTVQELNKIMGSRVSLMIEYVKSQSPLVSMHDAVALLQEGLILVGFEVKTKSSGETVKSITLFFEQVYDGKSVSWKLDSNTEFFLRVDRRPEDMGGRARLKANYKTFQEALTAFNSDHAFHFYTVQNRPSFQDAPIELESIRPKESVRIILETPTLNLNGKVVGQSFQVLEGKIRLSFDGPDNGKYILHATDGKSKTVIGALWAGTPKEPRVVRLAVLAERGVEGGEGIDAEGEPHE